ncbi:MAG: tetratricopeptide repeat protein [Myxococcota bacterium]|nr:tetratricopeptide repeat protein [Myxococcota bacterium]
MRAAMVASWIVLCLGQGSGCSSPSLETTASAFELELLRMGELARVELRLDMLSAQRAQRRIGELSRRASATVDPRSPRAAAELARNLFDAAGLTRDIDDDRPELALPAGVLSRGRGSCLGLSGLYLAVARRLGWTAHLVLAPNHAFVRVTRAFRFNLTSAFYDAGQFDRALVEYLRVLEILPGFAQAHAACGLVLQRLVRPSQALEQYQAALRDDPNISAVRQNLRTLSLFENGLF